MRFRCLTKSRTLMFQPLKAAKVIYACIILHNIATQFRLEDNGIFEDEDLMADMNPQEVQGILSILNPKYSYILCGRYAT